MCIRDSVASGGGGGGGAPNVEATAGQCELLHVFTLLILTLIVLVLGIVAGAWLSGEADSHAETFHRAKPEVFAKTFGQGASTGDGAKAARVVGDVLGGVSGAAFVTLLAVGACVVKLVTPFEAAMHWLEWVKLALTFLGCLIITFGCYGFLCALAARAVSYTHLTLPTILLV